MKLLPSGLSVVFLVTVAPGPARAQTADEARKFVDALEKKLSDPDPKVRRDAAAAAGELGSRLWSLATRLGARAVIERDPEVRRELARALSQLAPFAAKSTDWLERLLADKDDEVRAAAIAAVGAAAPHSKELLPKIIPLIQDKNPAIRRTAMGAVSTFAPAGKEAIPLLIEALDDADKGLPGKLAPLRVQAVLTLRRFGAMGAPAADKLFSIGQESDDLDFRGMALATLAVVAPEDKRLMPLLVEILKTREPKALRAVATGALYELGPRAKEAVPVLLHALKASDIKDKELDTRVKSAIVQVLGKIGTAAKEAVPALTELANGTNELIQSRARSALQQIEGRKE